MTQCEKILAHLTERESITPLVALKEYGIMRLASRINDLRKQGYNITSKTLYSLNKEGKKVHYSEYRLEE